MEHAVQIESKWGIPRFIYRFGHHTFSDAITLSIN